MPQSYTCLWYHLIWATRERRPWLTDDLRPKMHAYLGGIVGNTGGLARCVGGVEDHVHALIRLHQDVAVAEAMRVIKTNSSAWMHEHGPKEFAWQGGYAAFSVSLSQLDTVAAYIANQEEHHRVRTFQEEIEIFLHRHDIDYKSEHLFI